MLSNRTRVALTILVTLWPFAALAQAGGAPQASADPLWMRLTLVLLAGVTAAIITGFAGVTAAIITGFFKMRELRREVKNIDHKIAAELRADLTKTEVETEARLKAEVRSQAARLRQTYLNALPYHVKVLKNQIAEVGEKLANEEFKREMEKWFGEIKDYGDDLLCEKEIEVTQTEFSTRCHYQYIFAMSTLYYTSVFFLFSERIRSLAPFTEADSNFSKGLDEKLEAVSDAFARRDFPGDVESKKRAVREKGLWDTVQKNMGAVVRKNDWYLSYPEFCRIFVYFDAKQDGAAPLREDHAFRRALDFFGAYGDPRKGDRRGPLLDADGANSIVKALAGLLETLENERSQREAVEQQREAAELSRLSKISSAAELLE